jgi:hypothetical protein
MNGHGFTGNLDDGVARHFRQEGTSPVARRTAWREEREMAEMMRAAMIHGPGEMRIDEVPRPETGPGQVLIRIRACGVCPSDVRT